MCLLISTGGRGQFTERALALGIDHHTLDPTGMGGGAVVFDYNNDGWQDIYLTGGQAPDQLYENLGNGTFEEVSKQRRITAFNVVKTMGVVAGDIDNDGYSDLLITTGEGHRNYLLRNEGGEYFTDISSPAGIIHEAWSSSATMGDYDGDGDLDIYVGNYVSFDALPFEDHITGAEANFLYRNEGNLTFTLVTESTLSAPAGCTLATLFTDTDSDGSADLFVLNDFGDFYQANQLFRQGVADTWAAEGAASGVDAAINAMGIAGGDFDEDGDMDYYVTNIGDNLYHQNNGDGTFDNVATSLYINDGTGSSWGTVAGDFNNDGHLDLYVNKGFLYDLDIAQFNRLYYGSGVKRIFTDDSRQLVIPDANNKARGVASGDFNNDGAIDLVVNGVRLNDNHTARSLIYMGKAEGNYLRIKLRGTAANASAIGSHIMLYAEDLTISREVTAGGSYLSGHEPTVHFGLGNRMAIDSIVIDWARPGKRQLWVPETINTTYAITESGLVTATDDAFNELLNQEHSAIKVSPNPAGSSLRIALPLVVGHRLRLELIGPGGQRSRPEGYTSGANEVTVRGLESYPAGIYTLRLQVETGNYTVRFAHFR